MLFDLRGRGRRRTVRAIYFGLALLMGVGLIGFGIGGGAFSGGLFNSLGSGSNSNGSTFGSQISAASRLTRRQPNNPQAWANLAKAHFLQAGTGSNYDQTSGQFTSAAQPDLQQAAAAWQHYLTLVPNTKNVDLANQMLQVYEGPGALGQPGPATQALQIIAAHSAASQALYTQLAVYAYQSNNARVGDLAAAKALTLAPKAQRAQLRAEFASVKASPQGTSSAQTVSAAPAATATVSSAGSVSVQTVSVSTTSAASAATTTPAAAATTTASVATTSTAAAKSSKH